MDSADRKEPKKLTTERKDYTAKRIIHDLIDSRLKMSGQNEN